MKDLLKLWPYIKPYKGKLILVFFLGLFMSLASGLVPQIANIIFDDIIPNSKINELGMFSILIIGVYFIHGIARYFHLTILKYHVDVITSKIREDLQSKFMNLSLTYHSSTTSGALLSRTLNDVTVLQEGLKRIADVAREPLLAIILLAFAFHKDWKLTLGIFVVAPLVIIVLRIFSKSSRKYNRKQMESLEEVTSVLKESLDGVRVIQSFNLQIEMSQRLGRTLLHYLGIRKKTIAREESPGPINEFIGAGVISCVIFYMGKEIIAGSHTLGGFLSYMIALGLLQPPIKKVQEATIRLQAAIASTNRVFDILNSPSVVTEAPNPVAFPQNWDSIDFKNIKFEYDAGSPVLTGINLSVKRGEVIAFVGTSGCGKSTLVNLLERFYDPTSGEISIGDIPTQKIGLKDLRDHIALVTQDVFLFNESISRNIQSGNFDEENITVQEAAKLANASKFISETPESYETMAGDRGARLSGGQKQRISIARAIYKNAPILILDEATSALDSASELEVQKGLEELMKGRTVFVIAHRLSTIQKADKIYVMEEGQVVESGNHESLLAQKGAYHQFHQLQ